MKNLTTTQKEEKGFSLIPVKANAIVLVTICLLFITSLNTNAQLQNWTDDYQSRPKPDVIDLMNRINDGPHYVLSQWSAGELNWQYQGTQSKVKILLPPGVINVYMTGQSNTFQNGPDMLTQWPVFGLFDRWDIGLFCNSWEPTDCTGEFVCKNDMILGNPVLSLALVLPEPNDTLRWIAYTQHNPATGNDAFAFGSNGSLNYIIEDTLLYNIWVDNGRPLPEDCSDFNPGTISGDQEICLDEIFETVEVTTPATGHGINYYEWYYRTNLSCDTCWILIEGANSSDYTPPAMAEGTYELRRKTINACGLGYSNIVTLTVDDCTTGISKTENEKCNIYMDGGHLIIEANNILSAEIVSMSGIVLNSDRYKSESRVVLENPRWPHGLHIVKVETEHSVYFKKIIL